VGVAVLDRAPGQHRGGERHREAELDVVAGVVPAAGQVEPDVRPVVQRGVAPPAHAVPVGQLARLLSLVEPERLLKGLAVRERRGRRLGARYGEERKGEGRRRDGGGPPGEAADHGKSRPYSARATATST